MSRIVACLVDMAHLPPFSTATTTSSFYFLVLSSASSASSSVAFLPLDFVLPADSCCCTVLLNTVMPAESDVEGCGAHHEDLPGTDPTKSPQIESPGTDMKTTRTSTGNDWAQSSGGAKHASHLQIVDPEGQGDEAEDGTSLPTCVYCK